MKSLTWTFKIEDISFNVYKSGWEVLVHHLETVTGPLPNCSASHFPVCPVSANTAFIRFNLSHSVFVYIIDLLNLNANLVIIFELKMENVLYNMLCVGSFKVNPVFDSEQSAGFKRVSLIVCERGVVTQGEEAVNVGLGVPVFVQ